MNQYKLLEDLKKEVAGLNELINKTFTADLYFFTDLTQYCKSTKGNMDFHVKKNCFFSKYIVHHISQNLNTNPLLGTSEEYIVTSRKKYIQNNIKNMLTSRLLISPEFFHWILPYALIVITTIIIWMNAITSPIV